MSILRSLASAFLMYSGIPVPHVEWKEENRRYALCFFPLIGAVIGALQIAWFEFCIMNPVSAVFRGVVSVLIPVLVTGGIHIDGFGDTTDAISSYADRQKRLEIMKDPHIGSFAVIGICSVFLLQFGLYCEIRSFGGIAAAALGYILSRALSGLAAVTLRSAKSDGSLQNFVRPADKRITVCSLTGTILLCAAAMLYLNLIEGAAVCVAAALCSVIYRAIAYRNFGGITGDTEGWFLQVTETAILGAVFISEVILSWL